MKLLTYSRLPSAESARPCGARPTVEPEDLEAAVRIDDRDLAAGLECDEGVDAEPVECDRARDARVVVVDARA